MDNVLRTILQEWQIKKLPKVISRDFKLEVNKPLVNNATVITGFRRVGKTYIIFEAIEKLLTNYSRKEVVYINFEDERLINPSAELLTNLIPEIISMWGNPPKYLFLDELQVVENWSKWVRRMLDNEDIQIFITGSSSKMSSAELPTELRGRAWEKKIYPLTFREFLKFKNVDNDFLSLTANQIANYKFLFEEYLRFGGLPAVVLTEEERKHELLQSYFQTVVQKEIMERNKVENELAMKTLLKLLFNSTFITISKLHNSLKSLGIAVGKSTVDNYLSYIENSCFMDQLYIFNASTINQLQYPRKVYFVDTGLMTALSTNLSNNRGKLLENLMYIKLKKEGERITYYKDKTDNEVDFLVWKEEKIEAMYQVCVDLTDEETRSREIKSIIRAGKKLGCSNLNLVTSVKPEGLVIPKNINVIEMVVN